MWCVPVWWCLWNILLNHSLFVCLFNQHLSSTYKELGLMTLKSIYATRTEWRVPQPLSVSQCLSGTSWQRKQNQSLREAVLFLESQGQQWSHLCQTSSCLQLEGIFHGSAEDHTRVRLRGRNDNINSVDHKISPEKPRAGNSLAGNWDWVVYH